ncbi:MAG TPA: hypothetical protein VF815_21425 [Myxococcaceae bacterium]|jgi:hypothetical protein
MTTDLSTPRLLELAHQYYPANLWDADEGYVTSEQYQRLLQARRNALTNSGHWDRFLAKVKEAFPSCRVEDLTVPTPTDNCWRVRIYLPEVLQLEGGQEYRCVAILVSMLAPAYVRYSSFHRRFGIKWSKPTLFYEDVPETKPIADKVEELVRAELRAQPLPQDTLMTLVPDIQCGNKSLGEVRLIDCLFTDDRW